MPGLLHKGRTASGSDQVRHAAQLFVGEEENPQITPGVVNLSPGWYQRGHDVHVLAISSSLRTAEGREWLRKIHETNAIISGILRIIHPELYQAGRVARERVKAQISDPAVIEEWASVFNGVSVISNRETLPHRDYNSRAEWYDILASVGTYEELSLHLPGLGLAIDYSPGTVVALLGKLLLHSVPRCTPDRVCYAWWFRENIHRNLMVNLPGLAVRQKMIASGYDGNMYI
ncbi:hypothetical protein DENSPDRAFT_788575 [Dentipellis sp. KUC8613]|nr:hypothetical protein DENSPDRAFT_788575 [Dentipellis sp. KUC8613]